ncbi:MAG: SAM-dependent methyltransferase [Spirochaetota bacterium]
MELAKPSLSICAVDIGNRSDNTARVIETLRAADIVFVESFREGSTLLKHFDMKKEMLEVSEHTTAAEIASYAERIAVEKLAAALISDCGTPLIEDPGRTLVAAARELGIPVLPVPGVSSITAALMTAPFPVKKFFYAGLLPRERKERDIELRKLASLPYPVVILDAPYRFNDVLAAVARAFGNSRDTLIGYDLTMESETVFTGTLGEALAAYGGTKMKDREFVIVVNGGE